MSALRSVLREPLIQFLLIGAVVATVYGLVPRHEPDPRAPAEEIVVTQGRIDQLRQLFDRTWARAPTDEELAGLIDAFVREEVLYRAGQDLGLDQDDAVVRRRIGQKMEFLIEPDPDEIAPTEADLARHLASYPERYRRPAEVAFRQVFVDPALHGGRLDGMIESLRERVEAGGESAGLGDPTMLPQLVELAPIHSAERHFGPDFSAELLALPTGSWVGPVASPFGLHLVRIERRVPARDPSLDEVRDAVRRDVVELRRGELAEKRFRELKARYRIVVEATGAAAPSPAAGVAQSRGTR